MSIDDIKFPPVWGVSTPPDYVGPSGQLANPLTEGIAALHQHGDCVELRVFGAQRSSGAITSTLSGFYDDFTALEQSARQRDSALSESICVTLNPLKRGLPYPVDNRLVPAKSGACATDADIDRIRWVLFDFDSVRPAGVCATADEHAAALAVGRRVCRRLHEFKATAFLSDSGNGAHVFIRVDLPDAPETRALIEDVMAVVSAKEDSSQVKLDRTTANPSRVVRLPGTMNRKGEDTPERPHRRAEVLSSPLPGVTERSALETIARATASRIQATAAQSGAAGVAPSDASAGQGLRGALEGVGLVLKLQKRSRSGGTVYVLEQCPFAAHAQAGKASVTQHSDGRITARCMAAKCHGKTWRDLCALHPSLSVQGHDHLNADPGVVCMADVTPRAINWIWKDRIAEGKVALFVGEPGVGKGKVGCAIAGALSTGRALPDTPAAAPVDVLFCTIEDNYEDTLHPRLVQEGADLSRIHTVIEPFVLNPKGLAFLEAEVQRRRARLVFIDPWSAYVGAGVDVHRANQTRPIFTGLTRIAERQRCGIVVVHHPNKSETQKIIFRASGNIDIVGAARTAFLFGSSAVDADVRAMISIKTNISRRTEAYGYAISDTGAFRWTGPSGLTAEDLTSVPQGESLAEAVEFLRGALTSGPRESERLFAEAKANGISMITLRRAKTTLGAVVKPIHAKGAKGVQRWEWVLPVATAAP